MNSEQRHYSIEEEKKTVGVVAAVFVGMVVMLTLAVVVLAMLRL